MNIFVTGGLGILGSSIVNKLLNYKHKLVIYERKSKLKRNSIKNKKNIKFVAGELNNHKLIKQSFKKYNVNVVFHLGAQTQVLNALNDPYNTYETNLISTIKILEIIRNSKKKILFIYSSSDKAYGEIKSKSYLETNSLSSDFPYDVSKSTSDLLAQSYSKTYGLKIGILRSANIYGPNDRNLKRIVPETIINLLKGKKINIRSSGKLKRDYIYVEDVAEAYYLTFKKLIKSKKKLLIYNIGSKYNLTVLQIVKKIASILKIKKKYYVIKNNSKREIKNQRLNYNKIKKELNWNPKTSLKDGLEKTIDWYKDNIKDFY